MDGIGDDQGPFLLGVCLTLYGLSVVAYAVRIWSRLSPKVALTAADYTITVSMVSFCFVRDGGKRERGEDERLGMCFLQW